MARCNRNGKHANYFAYGWFGISSRLAPCPRHRASLPGRGGGTRPRRGMGNCRARPVECLSLCGALRKVPVPLCGSPPAGDPQSTCPFMRVPSSTTSPLSSPPSARDRKVPVPLCRTPPAGPRHRRPGRRLCPHCGRPAKYLSLYAGPLRQDLATVGPGGASARTAGLSEQALE